MSLRCVQAAVENVFGFGKICELCVTNGYYFINAPLS